MSDVINSIIEQMDALSEEIHELGVNRQDSTFFQLSEKLDDIQQRLYLTTDEAWDNRDLGADENYVVVSDVDIDITDGC